VLNDWRGRKTLGQESDLGTCRSHLWDNAFAESPVPKDHPPFGEMRLLSKVNPRPDAVLKVEGCEKTPGTGDSSEKQLR